MSDEETEISNRDHATLVAACLKGDEAAWTEVWLRYGPMVKAVARRQGCDDDEAREVVQRVALVALTRLDALRDPAKLPGWLAGTARFQALEVIRQRRPHEELSPVLAADHEDAEARIRRDEELAVLRRAMLEIDARCRRLIQRLDLKEPADSYREVAQDEGLSPTSVGPIRTRCLQRLKKKIHALSRSAFSAH